IWIFGLKSKGIRNALNITVKRIEFSFSNLPKEFSGTKVLFLSDLHIDAVDQLADTAIFLVSNLDYDFCILGGDYSFELLKENDQVFQKLKKLVTILRKKSEVYGILGNHDRSCIANALYSYGVKMLVNDNIRIGKNNEYIYLTGLDDSHYFGSDDIEKIKKEFKDNNNLFKVMISHSPERYKEAENLGYSLYLTGHTHGGQICLPGGIIIIKDVRTPWRFLKGKWSYKNLVGYTSQGVGTSLLPVRFFSRPEITLISMNSK
ncbi:MAG: metallophosphoesterase, partial [Bacteroidales bacterium]